MTVGLAWLLTGCVTAPPLVAGRLAQIIEYLMSEEEPDLIARAGAAVAEGRYGEAETLLTAALSVDPYDGQALRQLAAVYRSTGRPARARSFEQMIRHVDRADSAPASAGVAGAMVSDDANNLQRFAALKRILDAGLITQEEYDERREANLGVLLPLTKPAPALNAERRPPLVRDVVERLVTITRFKQAGALVGHAFDVERDAILEGLMPMPKSELRKIAAVVPEALDPETHQNWLDRLLAGKLITAEEYEKESAVLVGLYVPAAGSDEDANSLTPGRLSLNDRPLTVMNEDTMAREEAMAARAAAGASGDRGNHLGDVANVDQSVDFAAVEASVTRVNIHLALSRTPESAQRSWDDLQEANGLALDGLIPRVTRVDLGGDKGIFFQLSAGPLATMAAAEELCDELLSRNYYCAPLIF